MVGAGLCVRRLLVFGKTLLPSHGSPGIATMVHHPGGVFVLFLLIA